MTKATKASPVVVNFDFDTEAYLSVETGKDASTCTLIRMVHSTIRPGVTAASIAARLAEVRPHDGDYFRMTVGHYAQTAALALSVPAFGETLLHDDASLIALYKVRTTGTATTRKAMVADYLTGNREAISFPQHVAAWAKLTRAAKTAARTASDDKVTAKVTPKNGGADAPADKGTSTPVNLSTVKFADLIAEVGKRVLGESDAPKRAAMVKSLKALILRATNAPKVEAPAETVAA